MITNDQMIAQALANMQDLNNQIELNLNILSNLDRMHSESHGGSMSLHDQVHHLRQAHETLDYALRSSRRVHGVETDGTSSDILCDRSTVRKLDHIIIALCKLVKTQKLLKYKVSLGLKPKN